MTARLNSRERVLRVFKKEEVDYIPVFSGMGNVTVHGLGKHGWRFADIHTDARKMASMAASTFNLFGFECAVAPFDLGVEAQALGAGVNFYSHRDDVIYPTISKKVTDKIEDLDIQMPADLANAGRVPIVLEALRLLKEEVGDQVAIGAWVLGPYTLAGQLVELGHLAKMAFKKTDMVHEVLNILADVIIELSQIYRAAGADYITIREMGACADILSPRMFKALIQPSLERIFTGLDSPNVLHICGDTGSIIDEMILCGVDAISVDQKNDLAETRQKLGPDRLLFGNFDPYGVLVKGTSEEIDKTIKEVVSHGVDAIWPGCDIWPTVPWENMEALMTAARKYGKLK